jgi:hypothetical protein
LRGRPAQARFSVSLGEWLFQKARLIIAALIAKIHTIEWTPALMNSPEGKIAMRSNWWGLLGEHYARAYGGLSELELVSGIPGSPTEQHAARYAMTEEFTACYRMHPLMPDTYSFRSHDEIVPSSKHHQWTWHAGTCLASIKPSVSIT